MAKKVSLDKMLNGALLEMFRREMGRVAVNIHDMNTSDTAKRQITIKLEFKPDEERQIGEINATVQSRLCPAKSVKGKFLFGIDSVTKEGVASELRSDMVGQLTIDDADDEHDIAEESEKIVDLRAGRKVV
jgi:hypothetical protein